MMQRAGWLAGPMRPTASRTAPASREAMPRHNGVSGPSSPKMTVERSGMDPMQAKMMTFMMPVFLGYISLRYASGLGLYWIVGNVIGFIQQMIMNRTELGREIAAVRLKQANKRALKGK